MKDELLEWEAREYLEWERKFLSKPIRITEAEPPKKPISVTACCIWLGVLALWVAAVAVWLWRTA